MLSLLFLIGAVTSLSMIVPGVETEDENSGFEQETSDPSETDEQGGETSPDFISGSESDGDGDEEPTEPTPQPGDSDTDDTTEEGDTTTDPTTPEDPSEGEDDADDGAEGGDEDTPPEEDAETPPGDTEDDTDEGVPEEEETSEEEEPTAPTLPAEFNSYDDAARISLTYADGVSVEIDLDAHKDIDLGDDDRGYQLYRIDLEDGSHLEFALDWDTPEGGAVQGTQQVELTLGDEQTDWDFREDAFTIIIKDDEGNALHSTPIDIDRLELNDQANTVVTSNTIKVYSPNDDAKDDIRVLVDDVDTGESHQTTHPYYHDTIDPPPHGSVQPSHVFAGLEDDDTVEVEIDPDIEGYVHLLTVNISQIPLRNLSSYSLNNSSGTTYQYVIQSDSAEAPDVGDLNLDKGGSVSPDSGVEVLGAFKLGKVTVGTSDVSHSSNISPTYTGKDFATETSSTRTFFV